MRVDGRALVYAVTTETALTVAAAFGGPHGTLGALPWMLNMPGILVIFGIPGQGFFLGRVALAMVIQAALWYAVFAFVRRRRSGAV